MCPGWPGVPPEDLPLAPARGASSCVQGAQPPGPAVLLPPLAQAGGAPSLLQQLLMGLGPLSKWGVQASALSSLPAAQPLTLSSCPAQALGTTPELDRGLPCPGPISSQAPQGGRCLPSSPLTMGSCPVSLLRPQEAPGGVPVTDRGADTPCRVPSTCCGPLVPRTSRSEETVNPEGCPPGPG